MSGPWLSQLTAIHHTTITNQAGTATTIRDAGGTYSAPFGAWTPVMMDTVLHDTDNAAHVSTTTANITAITAGATTQVTLSANPWSVVVGDILILNGVTGVDAALLNGQSFAITAVNGLIFTLNVNTAAKALTATGTAIIPSYIQVPAWAQYVKITGHISYPDQNVASKHASIHLFRGVKFANLTTKGLTFSQYSGATWTDTGPYPTPEAHYHNRIPYLTQVTGTYTSIVAATGWIPVLATGEIWAVYGWQDTGASVVLSFSVDNWLDVEFK